MPEKTIISELTGLGLSTDAYAIIFVTIIIFYFFRQIVFYMIERHEETVKKLSEDYQVSLAHLRDDFSATLDRIERRGQKNDDT